MTDKFMQASDAAALVRQSIDNVVEEKLKDVLEFIGYAATRALTSIYTDVHDNPDVQEAFTKKLEALGYKVRIVENNEIEISWSK